MTTQRVTVTLNSELVESIDRLETNRSRFIAQAVAHELDRRRREEFLRCLDSPHPDSAETADLGFEEWIEGKTEADDDLLDEDAGTAVRWVEGQGWLTGNEA